MIICCFLCSTAFEMVLGSNKVCFTSRTMAEPMCFSRFTVFFWFRQVGVPPAGKFVSHTRPHKTQAALPTIQIPCVHPPQSRRAAPARSSSKVASVSAGPAAKRDCFQSSETLGFDSLQRQVFDYGGMQWGLMQISLNFVILLICALVLNTTQTLRDRPLCCYGV